MFPAKIPETVSAGFSRCEERSLLRDQRQNLSPSQKADAVIKKHIDRALWNDDVLRAIEMYQIAVHVKDGTAYLSGHVVNTSSHNRVMTALRAIPGLRGVQNDLVLDDKLTTEVAGSLGKLEHTYGCKFFTGASHGVISLNGNVSTENVKSLAEKRAASHPHVRAVINNVQVIGAQPALAEQPFIQPTVGEKIYFRDGISGVVTQVVINPDNRRVVAVVLLSQFATQGEELSSLNSGQALPLERLVVIPIDTVRYLNRVTGFLHIGSEETSRYTQFDADSFRRPAEDWVPPYPYCTADVLFAVERRPQMQYQLLDRVARSPFVVSWVDHPFSEELLANDSLGG